MMPTQIPIPIYTSIVFISATADSKMLQNIIGNYISLNGRHIMVLHQKRRREPFGTKEGTPY